MKKHIFTYILIFSAVVFCTSCNGSSQDVTSVDSVFTVSTDSAKFGGVGGNDTLTVIMNGNSWAVSSDQTWCILSLSLSSNKTEKLVVTTTENTTGSVRTANLTFVMDQKKKVVIPVQQAIKSVTYPDYSDPIAADATGMSSAAKVLAAKIFAGWNLGNSLEVPSDETAWGNPKTTQVLIDSIKAAGFNAIRIPCAWNSHIEDALTCKISAAWLTRVKQVIDYCYKNDMYVIINIHYDEGWLENNPTYAKQNAVNAKQKALWEQIAVYFRDYDEHLLFAGTNEVHINYDTPTTENITVQQSYNQTFVTAVRSTGGKNANRNLIIQSYNTNIGLAISYLKLPSDKTTNRMMVEVHYYDPWEFCGNTSSSVYLWGTSYAQYGSISNWGQEDYVKSQFQSMKTNFIDKGYPVILGEYGAIRRSELSGTALTNHLASHAYYLEYVTKQAKNYGLVPFYWDNGVTGNDGFGIFYRSTGAVFEKQALTALQAGAAAGVYPY